MIAKFHSLFLYTIAIILRPFLRIKPGRVAFFSYYGKQYSCNPRYISEFLNQKYPSLFESIWFFKKGFVTKESIEGARCLQFGTLKALIAINSSEFVITNCRTLPRVFSWVKSGRQKYIMTWHGGLPIKKVEADASEQISAKYIHAAKVDSSIADLFLSESRYTTELYRNSFCYKGEVLEKGIPRSDIFYDIESHKAITERVYDYFGICRNNFIVLYAPTFRDDYSFDKYDIDWKNIKPELEKLLGGPVCVLVRLHPNFLSRNIDTCQVTRGEGVYNATSYSDINDLLISSSVLFSDYSSCMFDYAILKRPCFIYAKDSEVYNRGFYFSPRSLPFPFATNNIELKDKIRKFNNEVYMHELLKLTNDRFGLFGDGHATEAVVGWMIQKTNEFRQA